MKPADIDPIRNSYYSPGRRQRDDIYVPVDPFAPSIAFSLNNYLPRVFRRKLTEKQAELWRPPPNGSSSPVSESQNIPPVPESQAPNSAASPDLFGPRSDASFSSASSEALPRSPSESHSGADSIESDGRNRTPSAVGNDWETQGANEPYAPEPSVVVGAPHEPDHAPPAWRTVHSGATHRRSHSIPWQTPAAPIQLEDPFYDPVPSLVPNIPTNTAGYALALAFLLDTLPRQVYLHLHLRLPYLYYSRVTRIFEEAEMSVPTIIKGILQAAAEKDADVGQRQFPQRAFPLEPPSENAAYTRLKDTWESFIDSLVKEWKTLNIISVLLLSAILTILQIEGAASDPLTRYTALLSMICSLMSLMYGCVYIIRFGTMRKPHKGAGWAEEAQKSRTGIFWNVWVMLAMPAIWLAWSMIFYLVAIMSFVWRTSPISSSSDNSTLTEASVQILLPRVAISFVLALGLVYFFCIASTLRRYGTMMDRAWQRKIRGSIMVGINLFSHEPKKQSNNGGWGRNNAQPWADWKARKPRSRGWGDSGWGAANSGSTGAGWGHPGEWGQTVPSSSWNAWDNQDQFATNLEQRENPAATTPSQTSPRPATRTNSLSTAPRRGEEEERGTSFIESRNSDYISGLYRQDDRVLPRSSSNVSHTRRPSLLSSRFGIDRELGAEVKRCGSCGMPYPHTGTQRHAEATDNVQLHDSKPIEEIIYNAIKGTSSAPPETEGTQFSSIKMLTSQVDEIVAAIADELNNSRVCRRCMQLLDLSPGPENINIETEPCVENIDAYH